MQSLGCTLHAMCFYESPFDKVHQRGDSIALAAMAGNIKLPETQNLYVYIVYTVLLFSLFAFLKYLTVIVFF